MAATFGYLSVANAVITGDFYKTKLTEIYFSEYAAIIKEKNKNLERFEASLQNQEEGKKNVFLFIY